MAKHPSHSFQSRRFTATQREALNIIGDALKRRAIDFYAAAELSDMVKAGKSVESVEKLLSVAATSFAQAHAANPEAVRQSAQPLVGELEANSELSGGFYANHIPGYGLQIMGTFTTIGYKAVDIQPRVDAITNVINRLASTVQGLDENDWVSVTVGFVQSPESNVTVRAKPGKPDSLEVWVDGKRQ